MINITSTRVIASKSLLRSQRVLFEYKRFGSIVPFKLADIGEGIAEVELMKWFVKVIFICAFQTLSIC
jgi:hypothetical protein